MITLLDGLCKWQKRFACSKKKKITFMWCFFSPFLFFLILLLLFSYYNQCYLHITKTKKNKTKKKMICLDDTLFCRSIPSLPIRSAAEQAMKNVELCRVSEVIPERMQEAEMNLQLAKQFFKDFTCGMHHGTVAECFSMWFTDDIEWSTYQMPLPLFSVGKRDTVLAYNLVCNKTFGGPTSIISIYVNSIKLINHDRALVEVTYSILQGGWEEPSINVNRSYLRFRNGRICEMLTTKGINCDQAIGSCLEATIQPVQPQPLMKRGPDGNSDVSSCGLSESMMPSTPDDGGLPPLENPFSDEQPPALEDPSLPTPPPAVVRPCQHNNWDSVRVKRQLAVLRCRVCCAQWKLRAKKINRCHSFMDRGVCTDANCGYLHVNSRKQTTSERQLAHDMDMEFKD